MVATNLRKSVHPKKVFKSQANSTRSKSTCCNHFPNDTGTSVHTIAQPVHEKGVADLRKRAKNKFFSQELARCLTTIESPLNRSYRRTLFECSSMLIQEGQKITSKYCNARWCNVCNRIRTAKLINGYRKALEGFSEPYFVTLTIPNPTGENLPESIKTMFKTIQLIVRSRRRITPFNGIRKLECTYNANEDTFHPHFHFIIDGKDNSEWLVNEWLKRNPDTSPQGQDFRKADSNSLMELFKYTTKIVSKTNQGFQVFIQPLDTIFQSMYKVRTFQPFGNVRMISEDIENIESDIYKDIPFYESLVLVWQKNDWYNMLTYEPLTGYEPSNRMIQLTTEKFIL